MKKMVQFGVIARNFSNSSAMQSAIKNITVIGGGLMGSGIAQVSTFILMKPITIFVLLKDI